MKNLLALILAASLLTACGDDKPAVRLDQPGRGLRGSHPG